MTHISAYDEDAKKIEAAADLNDVSEYEIMELLVEFLPQALENGYLKCPASIERSEA